MRDRVKAALSADGFIEPRQPPDTIDVDTVPRACLAIRMSALRQVGSTVETAQPGSETMEWHRRFQEQDWKVKRCAEARVIHYGGQAGWGSSRPIDPDRLESDLFFFKSGRRPASYSIFCAGLALTFSARAAIALIRRDSSETATARRCANIALSGPARA